MNNLNRKLSQHQQERLNEMQPSEGNEQIDSLDTERLDRLKKSADDNLVLNGDPLTSSLQLDINNSKINFEELLNYRSSILSKENKSKGNAETGPELKERA